jgi:5-methylcytosine-specific restriction enzyme A
MMVRNLKPKVLRSPKWPALARKHLREHPACEACGEKNNVVPHHKKPVHLFPDLELDPTNLVTLCESANLNCHLCFGHLRLWKSFNASVMEDVAAYRKRIENRP